MAKEKSLLEKCVANAADMQRLVDYAGDSIVSKTIIDKPKGTVTLFAFDAGQKLSEHTSPYDAIVYVIDGMAEIAIDGKVHHVKAGQIIIMPANVPHAVDAKEKFKMLLILIRD